MQFGSAVWVYHGDGSKLKIRFITKGISEYLLVVVLANLTQGFIILPLWLKSHVLRRFKQCAGCYQLCRWHFFKISVGTLPVTIRTAENALGVKPEMSRFLPLCTGLNMNGCAAFIFATVMYLMQFSWCGAVFGDDGCVGLYCDGCCHW